MIILSHKGVPDSLRDEGTPQGRATDGHESNHMLVSKEGLAATGALSALSSVTSPVQPGQQSDPLLRMLTEGSLEASLFAPPVK